ncbi:hypothetical protein [Noviherbaspirillum saxi]|uniref:hypothetical protein n=1 Tax=Noviherbaspirillum saxi TaxID=2320863 RepID=UPI0011C3E27B|nr:hypothetical protein [Noviherbaspirillum saxi]
MSASRQDDACFFRVERATTLTCIRRSKFVIALIVCAAYTTPSHSQGCQSTSYIPGITPFVMQHANGTTVALLADSVNYRRTAHVWINDGYRGQYFIPFDVFPGEVQVRLQQGIRYETFLARVRTPIRYTPYVIACGPWFGNFR